VNETLEQQKPRWGEPFRLPGEKFDTCRMFDNDFVEKFTRIHPLTPFVVYVPVLSYFLYRAWTVHELGLGTIVGMFVVGMLIWSFSEYVLHRWVFHWINETPRGKRIHFLLHGVHHDFPSDKDRLVMPLLTSVPFAVIFFYVIHFVCGWRLGDPAYAGFALGYLAYDGTHYAVHHFKQTTRIGKFLKRHHMLHHHADHDGGFGVSSPLWDIVFRTMPSVKKLAAKR
jgi:sterol desaturase/sphingolipid hydroxylase (fatty acid hydroxylase superfamily)